MLEGPWPNRTRLWTFAGLLIAVVACGGGQAPAGPTGPSAAAAAGAAAALANRAPVGEGFFVLVVQCRPKGDKRAHFEVVPATGSGTPLQLRCKGQGDLHGAGPWVVRPKSDTDQGYVCSPSPITLTEDKPKKNHVVCRH
jgi:hypothetical protein